MLKYHGLLLIITCMMTRNLRFIQMLCNQRNVRFASSNLRMSTVTSSSSKSNPIEQTNAVTIASAAAVAAAAVNAAVGMRSISAPDTQKSYVYMNGASSERIGKVDEVGLPLVYNKELIQTYWKKQGSALTQRWSEFLGLSVPFLTKMIAIVVTGGTEELKANGATLSRDARIIFEKLGPTYVKLGQMMSVRPDVLPPEALNELKLLQDSVKPFDTKTAIEQIESELGGPLGQFFSEISVEPVAAASLAQVYKAKLNSTGEYVAVKIQRPRVLEIVSKDLYVLRRAAEVYQGLMDRFAPQQRTNYVALLNEWAVGFYTELDFLNEAANQQRLKDLLIAENVTGIYIPNVVHELCTRRVLVSEWIDGKKLSNVEPKLLRSLIPDAQEAFLTQLLQVGFFHADPHPGNIFFMDEPRGEARLALLDFGLVAAVQQKDMDKMVSAIIHLANRDYANLVDDFIQLEILPSDCDRAKVIPLMDKALTPYVKGGGAKKYEEELRKIYGMDGTLSGTTGGFQQMTQDALTVLNDIPFSIPPYFALLARAIVTLEGIALTGDPSYGIIMESYPFVARKLLREDRPEIQRALQQVLYARSDGDEEAEGGSNGLRANRLAVLLNSALGVVAKSSNSFIDIDSIPEDAISIKTSLQFLLSPSATSLRNILIEEGINAGDILLRQAVRKGYSQLISQLPVPPFFGRFLPRPESIQLPFLIPKRSVLMESTLVSQNMVQPTMEIKTRRNLMESLQNDFVPVYKSLNEMIEIIAPKLTREEELYALSLTDLATQTLGSDAAIVVNGNAFLDPSAATRFALDILSSGQLPVGLNAIFPPERVKDVSKRVLTPLLLDDNRNLRFTSQGAGLRPLSISRNKPTQTEGISELSDALTSISEAEKKVLDDMQQSIVTNIRDRIIQRMQDALI